MRERKPLESASRLIGKRVHSAPESLRNTRSAASAANPTSIARTSIAPPRGTVAFPGWTVTSRRGTAASAVAQGTNSSRAPSRTAAGPSTKSNAATSAEPPSSCPARTMRGRSSEARSCNGRMAAAARVIRRADSDAETRWASGRCASCTAVSSAWRNCGACSSTYSAKRSSLARRSSGKINPRTTAAAMSTYPVTRAIKSTRALSESSTLNMRSTTIVASTATMTATAIQTSDSSSTRCRHWRRNTASVVSNCRSGLIEYSWPAQPAPG